MINGASINGAVLDEAEYLPEPCPHCGEELDEDEFCMECGYPHFHDEEE